MEDDYSDLLAPQQPTEKKPTAAPVAVDYSDLLAPSTIAAPQATQPTDDFSDLLAANTAPEAEGNDLESFGLGVKEQLLPFNMTKEEYAAPKDKSETASYMAGNIGAAVAGGATAAAIGGTIGGILGTAIPVPVVGTVTGAQLGSAIGTTVFAIYSGLGKDFLRSRDVGQEWSPLSPRALVSVATEVNPLVKHGGKIMTVLRAGGQVLAEGGLEYSYSGDKTRAVVAGGLGVITGATMFIPTSTKAGISRAENIADTNVKLKEVLESDTGLDMLNKVEARAATEIPTMAPKDSWGYDLKRWVIGADIEDKSTITKEFNRKTANWKPEQFEEAWRMKHFQDIAIDETNNVRQGLSREIAEHGVHDNTSAVGFWAKDAKFVARDADQVTGLNMEGLLDSFSEARNKHNVATTALMKPANEVAKLQKKLGFSSTDVSYVLADQLEKVSPAGKAALARQEVKDMIFGITKKGPNGEEIVVQHGWRTVFNEARTYISKEGYDVGFLDNYVPMYALRGADLGIALEKAKVRITDAMRESGAKTLADLQDVEAKGLVEQIVKIGERNGSTISSINDIDSLIRGAMSKEKGRLGYELSAMMARRGEMPDLIREWDVGKLYLQYLNGNLKAVHFDKAFKMLDTNISILDTLGMKKTAEYFSDLAANMSGRETGWQAGATAKLEGMRFAAEKAILGGDKTTATRLKATAFKVVPEFVAHMSNTVYPSFLGWNVRAALRNYTQPLMVTAPELGHGYGQKLVAKGLFATVKGDTTGVFQMEKFLQNKNLLGSHFRGEAIATETGYTATKIGGMIDTYNDWAMKIYSSSDTVNRMVTWNIAQQWAKDIASGHPAALKALNNTSTGLKSQLRAANAIGNQEVLGDILGRYLISKTQFNYGQEQLNKFGRETGRLFSMFTKWPAMVGSDIADIYKRKGATQGSVQFVSKYVMPMMALSLMSKYALEVDKNPMAKYLIGDLGQLAPLSSMESTLKGEMGSPVLRFGVGTAQGLYSIASEPLELKQAGRTFKRGVRETVKTYTPVVAPVLNEIDRISEARKGKKLSDEILEDLGFPKAKGK